MDWVKSHIRDGFFLCCVPCFPLRTSIFLKLSLGFWANDREVYKRPGKDVATAEVGQDTVQRGLNPD